MSPWLAWRVRFVDRAVALAAAVAFAPLLALLAVIVRIVDGSPALVRLPRAGRDAATFSLVKFRTMHQPKGALRAEGSPLTAGADARVTRLGAILRSTHLDEAPQLWNVIRGEMALLGPRPETPEYVSDDEAWQRALTAKPGIAGATQLLASGWEARLAPGPAGDHDYREVILPAKLAVDAWYVANATARIDGQIIVALLRNMTSGRGATSIMSAPLFPTAAVRAVESRTVAIVAPGRDALAT